MPSPKVQTITPEALKASAAPSTPPPNSGFIFSAGPGAAIAGLISSLIRMNIKLQDYDMQMGALETQVQGLSAQTAYKMGMDAAAYTGSEQRFAAGQKIASAGFTLVDAVGTRLYQYATMDGQVNTADIEKEKISNMRDVERAAPPSKEADASLAPADGKKDADLTRKDELLSGPAKYTDATDDKGQPITGDALKDANNKAIAKMTPQERAQFKKSLDTEYNSCTNELSRLTNDRSFQTNMNQNLVRGLTDATQTGMGYHQANQAQLAGEAKATESVLGSATQAAGQGFSTASDNLRRHYEAVVQLLGLLRQVLNTQGG